MSHSVQIQKIGFINHNVLQIQTQRPENYGFSPGQATEVALDKENWRDEKRPFTFTSLPDDGFLQFTIKVYPEHDGMTDMLQTFEQGNNLLIEDPWGAISYRGQGTFIAGGAGITPFIAIFKDLAKNGKLAGNRLLFANKREKDIILESKFNKWLGNDFINILSEEQSPKHSHGHIDEQLIKENTPLEENHFYVCGPPPMMESIMSTLDSVGVSKERIITEDFS